MSENRSTNSKEHEYVAIEKMMTRTGAGEVGKFEQSENTKNMKTLKADIDYTSNR